MKHFLLKVENFWLSILRHSKGCQVTYEALLILVRDTRSRMKHICLRVRHFWPKGKMFQIRIEHFQLRVL